MIKETIRQRPSSAPVAASHSAGPGQWQRSAGRDVMAHFAGLQSTAGTGISQGAGSAAAIEEASREEVDFAVALPLVLRRYRVVDISTNSSGRNQKTLRDRKKKLIS